MKIDTDLRQAVRSACAAQPDDGWQKRQEITKAAIAVLVAKAKHKGKVEHALALIAKAKKDIAAADAIIDPLGVSSDLTRITDDDAFVKAGGVIPETSRRWNFDSVMAELAS